MAENDKNGVILKVVAGVNVLVVALLLNTVKDLQDVGKLVAAHNAQIVLLREEMKNRTQSRYSREDADRDLQRLIKRIENLEQKVAGL